MLENIILLLTHCSVDSSTTNIIKVKTMSTNMRWFNFPFQTNIDNEKTWISMLNRRNSINVVSTLFCQR